MDNELILQILDKRSNIEIVEKILAEEREREKLYPAPDILDKLEKEPSINSKIAEKILGRILDKIELAKRFIELIPLYYDNAGVFWIWDLQRNYWRIIDETDVLNWLRNSAEINAINSKERTEILNALKLEARINKPLDVPRTWVQFDKEIVDIETGERFTANSKYFVTNPIPFKLGKYPDTPCIDKIFRSWVKEEDLIKLYEFIAFCLIPDYFIERIICLHGNGSNGKSVYRKIVRKFIGEHNCCSTSFKRISSSRFEATKLHRKSLCEFGETNFQKLDDTELIKKLVSGKDLIAGEHKGKGQFDFLNYAKIVISTNSLPPTDDKTDGFYRKWLIIDFPNQFPDNTDIMRLIPEEEYSNLGLKCIEIAYELLNNRKFSNEGDIGTRREKYEHRSNPLEKFYQNFIDDSDPNTDITKWEMEKRVNEWLDENKLRRASEVTIRKFLLEKNVNEGKIYKDWYESNTAVRKQVRCWLGIKWKGGNYV